MFRGNNLYCEPRLCVASRCYEARRVKETEVVKGGRERKSVYIGMTLNLRPLAMTGWSWSALMDASRVVRWE